MVRHDFQEQADSGRYLEGSNQFALFRSCELEGSSYKLSHTDQANSSDTLSFEQTFPRLFTKRIADKIGA